MQLVNPSALRGAPPGAIRAVMDELGQTAKSAEALVEMSFATEQPDMPLEEAVTNLELNGLVWARRRKIIQNEKNSDYWRQIEGLSLVLQLVLAAIRAGQVTELIRLIKRLVGRGNYSGGSPWTILVEVALGLKKPTASKRAQILEVAVQWQYPPEKMKDLVQELGGGSLEKATIKAREILKGEQLGHDKSNGKTSEKKVCPATKYSEDALNSYNEAKKPGVYDARLKISAKGVVTITEIILDDG